MSDNKRNRSRLTGKGYYIALILCAAAIGISGYLYYQHDSDFQETSAEGAGSLSVIQETEAFHQELPVMITEAEPEETLVEAMIQTEPEVTEAQSLKTMAPVSGQQVMPFSVEALSYNETTRDWRTHNGVDLAAEEGTEVCAAADGRVYTTYEDDSMGTTVVILHDGGYATQYASLREDIQVSAGDSVKMGQPIGYVGTTALVEAVLGPHVHWSVTYRDTPMDPADFLKLS